MASTFTDGSQVACRPGETKQGVIKQQSIASKTRKKTIEDVLELVSSKEKFEEVTLCPYDSVRAIVGNGKTYSIRGTNMNNTQKFNEISGKTIKHQIGLNSSKNQSMIKQSKNEFIYIKEEYYDL